MTLPDLSAIYARYEALSRLALDRFSASLAGRLLLCVPLDADGLAMAAASSIAGAASLGVESDAERARAALRAGLCDFVVGSLDEALRILKNELRRGLPVSVALAGEPPSALAAMIDRGLQPDLVSLAHDEPLRAFLGRGATAVPEPNTAHNPDSALLAWSLPADAARSMPQIARLAVQSLDPARADTAFRQRWLERAPRQLGRALAATHCVRMAAAEEAAFLAAVRPRFPAVGITRDGTAVRP